MEEILDHMEEIKKRQRFLIINHPEIIIGNIFVYFLHIFHICVYIITVYYMRIM